MGTVEGLAVEGDGVRDVSPTTTSLQSHLELLGSCPASDDASSLPVSRMDLSISYCTMYYVLF